MKHSFRSAVSSSQMTKTRIPWSDKNSGKKPPDKNPPKTCKKPPVRDNAILPVSLISPPYKKHYIFTEKTKYGKKSRPSRTGIDNQRFNRVPIASQSRPKAKNRVPK